jgi:hypothetical protein
MGSQLPSPAYRSDRRREYTERLLGRSLKYWRGTASFVKERGSLSHEFAELWHRSLRGIS